MSAGLLLEDFARMRSMDIGVRTDGVWTAAVRLPEAEYGTVQQRFDFAQSLLEQARGIRGVETAALSDRLPLEGGSNYYATSADRPFQRMSGQLVETHSVSPDYFRAMGVRLLAGPRLHARRHAGGHGIGRAHASRSGKAACGPPPM